MTRRTWYVTVVVIAAAASVLILLLRDSTPGTLNVAEAAGLQESVSMDILVPGSGDQEQWITITSRDTVAELTELLDEALPFDTGEPCPTEVTLRFYSASGGERIMAYGCESTPRLRGEDEFWRGGSVVAPPGFVAAIEAQLALLP